MIDSMTDKTFPAVDMEKLKIEIELRNLQRDRARLLRMVTEGMAANTPARRVSWLERTRAMLVRMARGDQ